MFEVGKTYTYKSGGKVKYIGWSKNRRVYKFEFVNGGKLELTAGNEHLIRETNQYRQ